ncbi:hypothetical protein IEE83_26840 [Dyadobacter sp. UP-52]|uniref:Uncharacterized protein n=2 Tax=Dyadobacter subterraneus TaxID=2773304 RepID=A0ABR9WJ38_9BACT|nr:hypothetical protein [Dyadobacter subterraneus]
MNDDFQETDSSQSDLWAKKKVLSAFLVAGILLGGAALYGEFIKSKDSSTKTETAVPYVYSVTDEYLGTYHGTQASYNLKNKYGSDMVVNGRYIRIAPIDFKLELKRDGEVNLVLTSLEDNQPNFYQGNYSFIVDRDGYLKLECNFSDGTTNPRYYLDINNVTKNTQAIKSGEPTVDLVKIL